MDSPIIIFELTGMVPTTEAWHVSMTTDPLMDSDDEMYADENTRLDYGKWSLFDIHVVVSAHTAFYFALTVLRLRIISRLRGKEPTPPRDLGPTYNMNPVNPMIALGAR